MTKSTIKHVLSKAGLGGNFTARSARSASACNALLMVVPLNKITVKAGRTNTTTFCEKLLETKCSPTANTIYNTP